MPLSDLDEALATTSPEPVTATSTTTPRPCRRHAWREAVWESGWEDPKTRDNGYEMRGVATYDKCLRCGKRKDPIRSRRNKNNGKRGRAAELVAARAVGGRKVGPLGFPWDIEMPGYARIQVRKYARPESMRAIAAELARIAAAPGPEMPGYLWVEPGRGGERLIVFRAKDFAERHGTPTGEDG